MTKREAKRWCCRYLSSLIDARCIPDDNAYPSGHGDNEGFITIDDLTRIGDAWKELAQEMFKRGRNTP